MAYVIGPGVEAALADNGDEARSDERYIIMEEGHRISLTFGRDATYFWYEEENAVKRQSFR